MAYRSRLKMGVEVLRFAEDLSAAEMVKIKNRLARLEGRKHLNMLIDLSRTKHVELAGLGILVDRLMKIRAQKGDVRFCNLSPEVERTFQMVGVGNLMRSFHTEAEALESFSA